MFRSIRSSVARGLALLLVIFTMMPAACNNNKTSDKDFVYVSADEGQRLAAGERNLLGKVTAATWVDARSKADYDAGHIPAAISLPFENVTAEYSIIKDKPIVIVYGADYNDARGKGMVKRLWQLLPHHDIRFFDGGVRAWKAAGNQLEATQAK